RKTYTLLGEVEVFAMVPLVFLFIPNRPEDYGVLPDGRGPIIGLEDEVGSGWKLRRGLKMGIKGAVGDASQKAPRASSRRDHRTRSRRRRRKPHYREVQDPAQDPDNRILQNVGAKGRFRQKFLLESDGEKDQKPEQEVKSKDTNSNSGSLPENGNKAAVLVPGAQG
ncbi:unnamed protein product, partial [Amoebophrya sp. A25]